MSHHLNTNGHYTVYMQGENKCTCANFHAHMNPISKVEVKNNGLMWVVSLKKITYTHVHITKVLCMEGRLGSAKS